MRALVVCVIVSADGYYAGPGGMSPSFPSTTASTSTGLERLRAADIELTGRVSYEQFRAHWPDIVDDPDASQIEQAISREHNAKRQLVVSDSLTIAGDEPWAASTTVIQQVQAHETVRELLDGDGGDVLVFGSRAVERPARRRTGHRIAPARRGEAARRRSPRCSPGPDRAATGRGPPTGGLSLSSTDTWRATDDHQGRTARAAPPAR